MENIKLNKLWRISDRPTIDDGIEWTGRVENAKKKYNMIHSRPRMLWHGQTNETHTHTHTH